MCKVIIPTAEQWKVINEIFFKLYPGGVIIPPETAKEMGIKIEDVENNDYDFGGEADYWVDIANHEDHYFFQCLKEEEDE